MVAKVAFMRFAISIPQLDTGTFDARGVKCYLARAEELGFESGWTMEQTIGPTPVIAPCRCSRMPPPAPNDSASASACL
jgi:hypothetical protein